MSLANAVISLTPTRLTPGAGLLEKAKGKLFTRGGALGLGAAVDMFFGSKEEGEPGRLTKAVNCIPILGSILTGLCKAAAPLINILAVASIFVPALMPVAALMFVAKGAIDIANANSLMEAVGGGLSIAFALPQLGALKSAWTTARAASVRAVAQPGQAFNAETQKALINNFRSSVHNPIAQEFKTAGSELSKNLRLGNNPVRLDAATIQQTQGRLTGNIGKLESQIATLRGQASTLQQQVTQATAQNTANEAAQKALDIVNRRLANAQRAFTNTQVRLRAIEDGALRVQRAEAALRNSRTQLNTLEQGARTQTAHTVEYNYFPTGDNPGQINSFFRNLYGNDARYITGTIDRATPLARSGYKKAGDLVQQARSRYGTPSVTPPVPSPLPSSVPVPPPPVSSSLTPPVLSPTPVSVGGRVHTAPDHLL